jgi:hypothetical protein
MDNAFRDLDSRLAALEAQNRHFRTGIVLLLLLFLGSVFISRSQAQQSNAPLRVRSLVIEDTNGRDRVVVGAPLADGRRTGLRINDANGVERVGLSLMNDGSVVMGFDAPPGTGNDGNRERITLVADQNGGAFIRFLDRRTSVAARMYLDNQNLVWLEFSDFMQDPTVRRRIGLKGEETIRAQP